MRDVDIVGRYSGEELLILLPDTGTKEAAAAAERLKRRFKKLTVSLGACNFPGKVKSVFKKLGSIQFFQE